MVLNYVLAAMCALVNSGIYVYASYTSSYAKPVWGQEQIQILFYIALVPAGIMFISAWQQKSQSSLLAWCAGLTLLSGILFTAGYINERDVSRIFWLAPHFILTYVFAIASLFSKKKP